MKQFLATTSALTYFLSISSAQYECSADNPCDIGCCSTGGFCGFGPEFCGDGNCVSNCDAKAECGRYAPAGQETCPLDVCCSKFGFCGTTNEFCGDGCQSGCDPVQRPSCGGSSSGKRTIGYYESWASERGCDKWLPEDIDPFAWTHVFYSFALVDSSHKIAAMNSYDTDFYRRTTNLKLENPALKVFIAVGGWDAGGKVFSDMASSAAGRRTFIESALQLMQSYAFDGIDIDWEYPFASDRGGAEADIENFTLLMKELKAACGNRYGITLTLPSSYWYMQGFDVNALQDHVDWFQFMSYDIHGTWDGNSPWTQPVVAPHTNLTEIANGLDLLWRNKVSPAKVVLGLGYYGRSFTLADPACKTPGCKFTSGAKAGQCTVTSGVLSNAEIQRIIRDKGLTPMLDREAGVKYINWEGDQWVSYDDQETYQMKKDFANKLCLGGTMVWALDQEDKDTRQSTVDLIGQDLKFSGELDAIGDELSFYMNRAQAYRQQLDYGLGIFWTECQPYSRPSCPYGFKALAYGHGKVYDADFAHVVADGCHGGGNGYNRALCAPANTQGECKWFGKAKSCNTKCPSGWWQVSQNSHVAFEKTGCQSGRYAKFCCKSLWTPDPGLCYDERNAVADLLSGGNGNWDKRGLQDYYYPPSLPCNAKNLDRAFEFQDVNGWFGAGVEGHFTQVIDHSWRWEPAATLQNDKPQATKELSGRTTTVTVEITERSTTTRVCDGAETTQACHHYSSVIRNTPAYALLPCPKSYIPRNFFTPAEYTSWNLQHTAPWYKDWIPSRHDCERDEFPFHRFWAGSNNVRIRFIPGKDNNNGGKIAQGICPQTLTTRTGATQGGPVSYVNGRWITTVIRTDTVSQPVLSLSFTNCNSYDAALPENPCLPTTLTDDPGFALITQDDWYRWFPRGFHRPSLYRYDPPAYMTQGKSRPRRRNEDSGVDGIVVDLENTSCQIEAQELEELVDISLVSEVIIEQMAEETQCNSITPANEPTSTSLAVARPGSDTVPRPTGDSTKHDGAGTSKHIQDKTEFLSGKDTSHGRFLSQEMQQDETHSHTHNADSHEIRRHRHILRHVTRRDRH